MISARSARSEKSIEKMGYPTKKYREKKVKYEKRSWFLSFRQSPTVGVLDDEKSCCRKISERLTTIIMENHPAHSDYVYALVSLQIGEKRLYRKHISSSEKRNCTRSIEQSTRKSKRKESVGKRGKKDRINKVLLHHNFVRAMLQKA
jgi:hypothetical protein